MKISFDADFSEIKKYTPNWKVFWLTCIPMFIIVLLQHMGVEAPNIFSFFKNHAQVVSAQATTHSTFSDAK